MQIRCGRAISLDGSCAVHYPSGIVVNGGTHQGRLEFANNSNTTTMPATTATVPSAEASATTTSSTNNTATMMPESSASSWQTAQPGLDGSGGEGNLDHVCNVSGGSADPMEPNSIAPSAGADLMEPILPIPPVSFFPNQPFPQQMLQQHRRASAPGFVSLSSQDELQQQPLRQTAAYPRNHSLPFAPKADLDMMAMGGDGDVLGPTPLRENNPMMPYSQAINTDPPFLQQQQGFVGMGNNNNGNNMTMLNAGMGGTEFKTINPMTTSMIRVPTPNQMATNNTAVEDLNTSYHSSSRGDALRVSNHSRRSPVGGGLLQVSNHSRRSPVGGGDMLSMDASEMGTTLRGGDVMAPRPLRNGGRFYNGCGGSDPTMASMSSSPMMSLQQQQHPAMIPRRSSLPISSSSSMARAFAARQCSSQHHHQLQHQPPPVVPPRKAMRPRPPGMQSFPIKLHQILNKPEYSEYVTWMPHGRSWRILKARDFETCVLPKHFRSARYASFMRQVNGWGFRRITDGPDLNAYFHPCFVKGMPELCEDMRRPQKGQNPLEWAEDYPNKNPDFYKIQAMAPLPSPKEKSADILGSGSSHRKDSTVQEQPSEAMNGMHVEASRKASEDCSHVVVSERSESSHHEDDDFNKEPLSPPRNGFNKEPLSPIRKTPIAGNTESLMSPMPLGALLMGDDDNTVASWGDDSSHEGNHGDQPKGGNDDNNNDIDEDDSLIMGKDDFAEGILSPPRKHKPKEQPISTTTSTTTTEPASATHTEASSSGPPMSTSIAADGNTDRQSPLHRNLIAPSLSDLTDDVPSLASSSCSRRASEKQGVALSKADLSYLAYQNRLLLRQTRLLQKGQNPDESSSDELAISSSAPPVASLKTDESPASS